MKPIDKPLKSYVGCSVNLWMTLSCTCWNQSLTKRKALAFFSTKERMCEANQERSQGKGDALALESPDAIQKKPDEMNLLKIHGRNGSRHNVGSRKAVSHPYWFFGVKRQVQARLKVICFRRSYKSPGLWTFLLLAIDEPTEETKHMYQFVDRWVLRIIKVQDSWVGNEIVTFCVLHNVCRGRPIN